MDACHGPVEAFAAAGISEEDAFSPALADHHPFTLGGLAQGVLAVCSASSCLYWSTARTVHIPLEEICCLH